MNKGDEVLEHVVFRGRIMTVGTVQGGWEMVAHAPAVAVLAMDGTRVLGVEQYRHVVGRTMWELPAGIIDPGETPLEAAHRELAEETQLGGDLAFVAGFYVSPGFTNEHITVFEATNLRPVSGTPDDTEELTVRWRELDELAAGIRDGTLTSSASTITGLLHAIGRSRT